MAVFPDDAARIHIATRNPIRYRSYYYDTETELYYLNARYYDAGIRRFLSADTLIAGTADADQSYNLYAYCVNDPVNRTDGNGHWSASTWAKIAVGAVVVAAAALVTCGAAVPVMAAAGCSAAAISAVAATAATVAEGAILTAEVSATAALVTNAVKSKSKIEKGNYESQSVYVKRDQAGVVQYVGRTNNPVRRDMEHGRNPKLKDLEEMEVKFTGLTVGEARVVEQLLISAYVLDDLRNARREIAVRNVNGFKEDVGNIANLFTGAVDDELLNLMGR